MTMERKAYVLVEGHGEVQAAGNLLARLSPKLGMHLPWRKPIRWQNLHQEVGLVKGANFIRAKQDAGALLILRDEDDACPKQRGPEMAEWLRRAKLPFPSAVVLLHPEYEVLFLPCLDQIAGKPLDNRPGLVQGTTWDGAGWEARRGVKEWLTKHYPPNRSYKPTIDQLPLTRLLDFDQLRSSELPCFGTLERALTFLGQSLEGEGEVYP